MHKTQTVFVVVLLACPAFSALASEEKAEQRGLAVIDHISQPLADDYTEFIQANFDAAYIEQRGIDGLQRIFKMLSDNHQQMTVATVDANDDTMQFLAQDAAGMWLLFEFHYGPDPENLIAGLAVQPAQPPRDPNALNVPEAEWLSEFKQFIDARIDSDKFSGAVIVAKGDTPVYAKAIGDADKEHNVPNRLDTPINLGSMNKMFTGVAVAQLVEQNKLSYDDLVGKYLPRYPNADVREKVTIHQLLTHTSGLNHYWNDAYEARKRELRTHSDFAELFQDDALLFEPGARLHYSNNGPVVLGLIIEAITGMDYYDYVRKNIYQVAGMEHSDHYEIDDKDAGFAVGYYKERGETNWQNNTPTMGRKGSAGGGGYASANDLLRFSIALMDGQLLGDEQIKTMTTGKVDMGPNLMYAYLIGEHFLNKHRYIGHNGGAPGISADFSIFPDLGYTVIVLANYGRAAAPVADKARQLIAYNN